MPGLARKILICAAVDGLIIQPLSPKGQKPYQPVRVKYGEPFVSSASREQAPISKESSFEAFGVIGLVTISSLSYLITITGREQVAQLFGSPIYVVTEVAVTPCSSRIEAEESIQKTALHLHKGIDQKSVSEASDDSADETEVPGSPIDELEGHEFSDEETRLDSAKSSVAEDVIRRKGSYGRFAHRWFSGSGWTLEQQRSMSMSNATPPMTADPDNGGLTKDGPEPKPDSQVVPSILLPKFLRTAQLFFGSSRSFYFAYDLDITRSLEKRTTSPMSEAPLYSQVDSGFFWNRHILRPFLSAGQDSLALPLMQGFVGQRNFVVDSQPPQDDGRARDSFEMQSLPSPTLQCVSDIHEEKTRSTQKKHRPSERRFTIALISRRSTKRAGLRYLRRGIDQDGFVANMVETEQLLTPYEWSPSSKVYSFVQIRGSIPLFFTQSPYSIKPVPALQHSDETNWAACKVHFARLTQNYGAIQVVNLVEKNGVEAAIGTRYSKAIEHLNSTISSHDDATSADRDISLEWFDFHHACRGMKFENVSLLLSNLKDKLEMLGSSCATGDVVLAKQKGVVRTNCMDCLDRTNVCQSSFAKHMLEVQLKEEGIDMSLQIDQETSWFNTLWADNGDAISKQYASTAAMKGDYTRTKKRDYRGALNDLGLSLARFYSGMVNDYFSQTAIDFLLGNVTDKVFDEFESDMMTKDPAMSMSKMREQAIELCHKRVVADENEEFHGGWTLLSPQSSNTIRSYPMEEVVLLLTDVALYLCRFDWNMEKVSSFERIHLSGITKMELGTYITSITSASQTDELKNFGFAVIYQPGETDIKRTNTRTLSSVGDLTAPDEAVKDEPSSGPLSFVNLWSNNSKRPTQPTKKLAFKAPYWDSSVVATGSGPRQTEMQLVTELCAEIERMALMWRLTRSGEEKKSIIEKKDIISLEEAKRNTGLIEQLGYSIKRLVWA